MDNHIFKCPRSALVAIPQVLFEYALESLPAMNAPRVLDIGANVGAFAWAVLRQYPDAQVFCFEPHPTTCAFLIENMGDVVQVTQAAVVHPKTAETAKLFEGLNANTESSLRDDVRWPHVSQDLSKSVDVPLIDSAGLGECDLLKVDTEGSEVEILTGYPHLDKVQVLLVEAHAVGGDLEGQKRQIAALAAVAGLGLIDVRGTTLRFMRGHQSAAMPESVSEASVDGWLLVETVGGSRWLGKGPADFSEQQSTVTLQFAHELSVFRNFYPVPAAGDDGINLMTGTMTVESAWRPYDLPGNHAVTLRWSTVERLDAMTVEARLKLLSRLK